MRRDGQQQIVPTRAMKEAELQDAVIELAQRLGYLTAHFRPAQTERGWRTSVQGDGAGFPDVVLIRPRDGRILVRELKVGGGKADERQLMWLSGFNGCGVDARVWRDTDWWDGTIERELRGT
jgi:hypothetical protein